MSKKKVLQRECQKRKELGHAVVSLDIKVILENVGGV